MRRAILCDILAEAEETVDREAYNKAAQSDGNTDRIKKRANVMSTVT
jgi:hypothetical protein